MSQNLEMFAEDAVLRQAGYTIDYVFDWAVVKSALLGYREYVDAAVKRPASSIQYAFDSDYCLLVSLLYAGWIGPFEMLAPHLVEFFGHLDRHRHLEKLRSSSRKRQPNGGGDLIRADVLEFLYLLGSQFGELVRIKSVRELRDQVRAAYTGQFSQVHSSYRGAETFFKLISLTVSDEWRYRLVKTFQSHRITAETREWSETVDERSPVFKEVLEHLSKSRGVTYSRNNRTDALAMSILADRVNRAKESKRVPRFCTFDRRILSLAARPDLKDRFSINLESVLPKEPKENLLRERSNYSDCIRPPEYFIFAAIEGGQDVVGGADKIGARRLLEIRDLIRLIRDIRRARPEVAPDSQHGYDLPDTHLVFGTYSIGQFYDHVWLPWLVQTHEAFETEPEYRDATAYEQIWLKEKEAIDEIVSQYESEAGKKQVSSAVRDARGAVQAHIVRIESVRCVVASIDDFIERNNRERILRRLAARHRGVQIQLLLQTGLIRLGVPKDIEQSVLVQIAQHLSDFLEYPHEGPARTARAVVDCLFEGLSERQTEASTQERVQLWAALGLLYTVGAHECTATLARSVPDLTRQEFLRSPIFTHAMLVKALMDGEDGKARALVEPLPSRERSGVQYEDAQQLATQAYLHFVFARDPAEGVENLASEVEGQLQIAVQKADAAWALSKSADSQESLRLRTYTLHQTIHYRVQLLERLSSRESNASSIVEEVQSEMEVIRSRRSILDGIQRKPSRWQYRYSETLAWSYILEANLAGSGKERDSSLERARELYQEARKWAWFQDSGLDRLGRRLRDSVQDHPITEG